MMRLRSEIERGARHPIVGPLLIVLLAVLIAFTVMHEGNEATGGQIGELCVGIALTLLAIIAFRPPAVRAHVALSLVPSRAPPRYQRTAPHSGFVLPGFLPLRL
jgi:hypothetical protein